MATNCEPKNLLESDTNNGFISLVCISLVLFSNYVSHIVSYKFSSIKHYTLNLCSSSITATVLILTKLIGLKAGNMQFLFSAGESTQKVVCYIRALADICTNLYYKRTQGCAVSERTYQSWNQKFASELKTL